MIGTRIPILILIASFVYYLSATAAMAEVRHYGINDDRPFVINISKDLTDGDLPVESDDGLKAIKQTLGSAPSARAVFVAESESGIGLGIYDPARHWNGLPFRTSDYSSARRLISFRQGSVASELRSDAANLIHAAKLLPDFGDEGSPPRADLVYPLFAVEQLNGQLIVSGLSVVESSQLMTTLRGAGYEIDGGQVSPFWVDAIRSPMVMVMLLMIALGELSGAISWSFQAARMKSSAHKEALLGGSRSRIAASRVPAALLAWVLANLVVALAAALFAGQVLSAISPPYLWTFWAMLLVLDLVVGISAFWLQAYRVARVERL